MYVSHIFALPLTRSGQHVICKGISARKCITVFISAMNMQLVRRSLKKNLHFPAEIAAWHER